MNRAVSGWRCSRNECFFKGVFAVPEVGPMANSDVIRIVEQFKQSPPDEDPVPFVGSAKTVSGVNIHPCFLKFGGHHTETHGWEQIDF